MAPTQYHQARVRLPDHVVPRDNVRALLGFALPEFVASDEPFVYPSF